MTECVDELCRVAETPPCGGCDLSRFQRKARLQELPQCLVVALFGVGMAGQATIGVDGACVLPCGLGEFGRQSPEGDVVRSGFRSRTFEQRQGVVRTCAQEQERGDANGARRRDAGRVDEALPVAEREVVVAGTLGQFGHLFQQAGLPGAYVGLF